LEDKRCCGRGVCIINVKGVCWCGQKWDGEKMISSKLDDSKKKRIREKTAIKKVII
jgi:hypothetical protein